jgi:hypothetical protein
MPYVMRKLPGREMYRVTNKKTGEVHCKECTKANAIKQIRLLNYVEHVPNATLRNSSK